MEAATPLTFEQQLNVFHKELSKDLKAVPKTLGNLKKCTTLTNFLEDRHNLEEMVADVKRADALLNRVADADGTNECTLKAAMLPRHFNPVPVEHFSGQQLRSFSLHPYGDPLFPVRKEPPIVGEPVLQQQDKPKARKYTPRKYMPRRGNKNVREVKPKITSGTAYGLGTVFLTEKDLGKSPKKKRSRGSDSPTGTADSSGSYEIQSFEGLKLTLKLN